MNVIAEIVNSHEFTEREGVYTAPATGFFWYWRGKEPELLSSYDIKCRKVDDVFYMTVPEKVYLEFRIDLSSMVQREIDLPELKFSGFLRPYQVEHARYLKHAFRSGNILDASETGVGKTYVSLSVAEEFGLPVFVITPKTVIGQWKSAVSNTGTECLGIVNYEALKPGGTKYLTVEKKGKDIEYWWNLPKDTIFIWDEIHRCKNQGTINADMLIQSVVQDYPCIGLSATVAENPSHFYAVGRMLGMFNHEQYFPWMLRHGMYFHKYSKKQRPQLVFSGSKYHLMKVHRDIFPARGHRVTKIELGDAFPRNQVTAVPCVMDNADKISEVYSAMKKELSALKHKKAGDKENSLTIRLRARQEVELLKVPAFVEMAEDALEEGNAVVMFVNFRETIDALCKRLDTACVIQGEQKDSERRKNHLDFLEDRQRLIIVSSSAGGIGIDLHDTIGDYPRYTIISPPDSAVVLVQVLGRTHRSGGVTPVMQNIVFASGTVEDRVRENVSKKIDNLNTINDGDLSIEEDEYAQNN